MEDDDEIRELREEIERLLAAALKQTPTTRLS